MTYNKPKFWDQKTNSIFSLILYPLSLITIIFNFLKFRNLKLTKFNIPVISIGNIYLGGTGKTPLCIELFKIIRDLNYNPGFVKKFYKETIDEKILLEKTGKVFFEKKRLNAVNSLIKNKHDIAIIDDGFQDKVIKSNLSIVCFNEKQWIGNGNVIPAGPLRERLSSLTRCQVVFINGNKNLKNEELIKKYNPRIKIFYTKYEFIDIKHLKNKKLIAFAGIGNPNNFFYSIKNSGLQLDKGISFPDHYDYTKKNIMKLKKYAIESKATLVTTQKDFLRINSDYRTNINSLDIELKIINKDIFIKELKNYL